MNGVSVTVFTVEMRRLRFSLVAIDPINLPGYKGSTFHGGFGHALEAISPRWFAYFFHPQIQQSNTIPKPFVLLPPLDEQKYYQAGEIFQCELTLFADATQHTAIAQAAIEYLGNQLGLGHNHGKFKIAEITESTYSETFRHTVIKPQTLTLQLKTRLRLKSNNQLQKHPPSFSLFMTRLMGRLRTLQKIYSEQPIDENYYSQLLQQAQAIQTLDSYVHWDDWDRYSGRQQTWMKFGGLLGELHFQGDLQPFLSCLHMGEWCYIGGKSSFGLGKYLIQYGDTDVHTST